MGLTLETIYIPGPRPGCPRLVRVPLTLFWLVALTNAYNFMDGIDGLAGGTAVIGFGCLMFVALRVGQVDESTLPCTLAAASLGFLLFNLPPARIFMGRCRQPIPGLRLRGYECVDDPPRHDRHAGLGGAVAAVPFHLRYAVHRYRRWRAARR